MIVVKRVPNVSGYRGDWDWDWDWGNDENGHVLYSSSAAMRVDDANGEAVSIFSLMRCSTAGTGALLYRSCTLR